MAMQTNLNKKDKMTIAIVLFAGLVFMIAWFLIKPTITSILDLNEKIEEAENTQVEYKNKIIYLSSAEALYGKAVDDLNESTKDYYEVMDSSEIDKMVTSYVLSSGLFSESLIIDMPTGNVEEAPYAYASDHDSGDDSGSTLTSTGTDTLLAPYNTARLSTRSTQSSGVQCVGLTLVVTGSRKNCQAFIDDLCTKPAVRITSFNMEAVGAIEQYDATTGTITYKNSGDVRLRIDVNLYMTDVADYESAVTDAVAGVEE